MEEDKCALELSSWPLNVLPSPTMAIKIMAEKLKQQGSGTLKSTNQLMHYRRARLGFRHRRDEP